MSKKYLMVYNEIRNAIFTGVYKDGDKIPAENELTEQFQVSRQTIRQAMDMLLEEKLIRRTRGTGTFVNKAAIRLNTKRIAVIAFSITESVFPAILSGIEAVLAEKGYSTMVFSTRDSVMRERQILKQLCDDPVDGIIMSGVESTFGCANLDLIRRLRSMGTKFVFMGIPYLDRELGDIPSVTMDDYDGVYRITRELIELGHHRVGGVFNDSVTIHLARLQAVRQAIIDSGEYYDNNMFMIHGSIDGAEKDIADNAASKFFTCDLIISASGIFADLLSETLQKKPLPQLKTIVVFDEVECSFYDGVDVIVYKGADETHGVECASKLLRLLDGFEEKSSVFSWKKK
ncbi:MAG: GntR family transcriptional regulator [Eubacteriales bacterium]|nr:GntR family transcriptional regulator [Eubacteriales bacterium]